MERAPIPQRAGAGRRVARLEAALAVPRVLVVAYFFPPIGGGGVHRPLSWARHLPAFGWDVTVLAATPQGYWVHDETLLAQVPPDTEILRVGAPTAMALWRKFLA